MYKAATFAGLVSLASAGSWGSSAPADYPPSGYEASSSSAAAFSSSIQAYSSSAPPAYGSSSSAPVYAPSSSAPVYAPSSSAQASATSSAPPVPSCDCWSKCFEAAGNPSESELCGNTGVNQCIHDTCSSEEDKKYWSWYDSYCSVSSSSSYAAVSSSSSYAAVSSSSSYVASSASYYPSSASSSASATPTPDCWNTCFDQNDITSESELCGNSAVNSCIYYGCSKEDDMKYWTWYNGYCPAPSSSSATFSSATFSTVTYSVSYSSSYSSSVPSATPTGNCWNECFAENNVESEASLCGNDNVSKCIHDTCSSDLDKAYWDWYNSYCSPATGTTTVTSVCTPTTPVTYPVTTGETTTVTWNTEPYTTTYVSTNTVPSTPKESSPVTTGWPSPPAAPPAGPSAPAAGPSAPPAGPAAPPAGPSAPPAAPPAASNTAAWSTPYSYPVAATGTGAWAPGPSASGYVPVAATGAGAANKPAGILAVVLAAAAFF